MIRFRNIVTLIIIIVVFGSCSNGNKTENQGRDERAAELTDVINVNVTSEMYDLASVWIKNFNFKYPGVKVKLLKGDSLPQEKDSESALLVSDKVMPEYSAYWKQKLAADIIILIFNNDNPYIQSLVYEGVKPSELKALLFDEKINSWAQFLESGKGKDAVTVYRQGDNNGATHAVRSFLNVPGLTMKGVLCADDREVLKSVSANPFALGFCSANLAYSPNGKFKTAGIYVLPIDLNENGIVDDNEHLFDRKDILVNAYAKGLYPEQLSRFVYVYSVRKPEGKGAVAFVEWLLSEGQNYLSEKSLIPITPKEK